MKLCLLTPYGIIKSQLIQDILKFGILTPTSPDLIQKN
jgi:hypothetical protein